MKSAAQKTKQPTEDPPRSRLIGKPEVLDRVGLSFPTLWSMMRRCEFPPARIVGGKTAWIETEVDAWIASRPLRKYKTETKGVTK